MSNPKMEHNRNRQRLLLTERNRLFEGDDGLKQIRWATGLFIASVFYGAFSYWLLVTTLWDVSVVLIMFITSVAAFWLTIKGYHSLTGRRGKISGWLLGIGSLLLSGVLLLFLLLDLLVLVFGAAEHIATSESPDGRYTVEFVFYNGGAVGPFGIRGELDGPLWFTKSIYHEPRGFEADATWQNDHTVLINGHTLDLQEGETFGYARDN